MRAYSCGLPHYMVNHIGIPLISSGKLPTPFAPFFPTALFSRCIGNRGRTFSTTAIDPIALDIETSGRGGSRSQWSHLRRSVQCIEPNLPQSSEQTMAKSRVLYGILSLVVLGMTVGAVVQIVLFKRLEKVTGSDSWENDPDARLLRVGLVKQEIISWSPRIILYRNFLSPEECDYLIAIARPRLGKSTVVDINTGKGVESKLRTSTSMFLTSTERKYPMIEAIEKRISTYSMVPVENGELLQVLRYEPGQFYRPHHDYFSDEFNIKRGGQRVATLLMYLSEGMQGGETYFPWASDKTCSCGGEEKKGICVKPRKGDAILFWSQKLDGTVDPTTSHGSCTVISGEKWSATKWLRQKTFS